MEAESQRILPESSQSSELIHGNNGVIVHHSDLPETYCTLCRRVFSPDEDMNESLETIAICGDCKFMFLEDLETNRQNSQESSVRGRRARYNRSSESIEDLFSQQFSHLINLVRQNQPTVSISASEHDQLEDGDSTNRSLQRTSSRTTPNRSRRWRRALSDNESEGFDNLDSVFGETESNVSFGWYGPFHGESDAVSFSAYGGDSDVSVDGRSFFDRQMFIQPDDGSDIDSDTDTDIDPMHAGLNQWNSDDQDEEDGEWEEADAEENTFETTEAEGWIQDGPENWAREIQSPEHVPMIRWRTRESRRTYTPNIFTNSEESEVPPYVGNSGDYLDGRSFEELLEQLAEADISRRGAPPAATSFVDTLPRLIINEEHGRKHGDLVCAVCKDTLSIGSEVSQLPCLHLYHPSCILPWLSSRNSCPLCRYELPTDDRDYEERKWNTRTRMAIREIPRQDPGADSSSSDSSVDTEVDEAYEVSNGRRIEEGELGNVESSNSEGTRGRWFFLAAAPIVSVVGIVLILWLRNPRGVEGRGGCGFRERGQQQAQARSSGSSSGANRNRRWWSLF